VSDHSPTNRRELFRELLKRAAGHVMRKLPEPLLKNELYGPTPTRLRPPGAGDWESFSAQCRRCGQCVSACRGHALLMDELPIVIAVRQPCKLCEDQPCSAACASKCQSRGDQRLVLIRSSNSSADVRENDKP
jgi:ferredoxin